MASLSEYQLYWYDVKCGAGTLVDACPDQFVFATQASTAARLYRVRSVQDLLQLITGHEQSAERVMAGMIALLAGNLLATGQWRCLLSLAVAVGLALIIDSRIPAVIAVSATLILLTWLFLSTIWRGMVSIDWVLTVTLVLFSTLATFAGVVNVVKQDPRSYVLLQERTNSESSRKCARAGPSPVAIRNDCCMDVKLLVFDARDIVRWVPHGGLLAGTLLPRGGVHEVGSKPPYVVKLYAPWEKELGSFIVEDGVYSFRATVPPLQLRSSEQPAFSNCTESTVALCICEVGCLTSSLWLPLAPIFARLSWPVHTLQPNQAFPLGDRPCQIRVYQGLWEQACCILRAQESVDYVGTVRWTEKQSAVRKSCSSLLDAVH